MAYGTSQQRDVGEPLGTMTLMKFLRALAVGLVVLAVPAPALADIDPPSLTDFAPEPIAPVAPVEPSESSQPGPAAPRAPRAPQLPNVANGPDAVMARVADISARVASISEQTRDTGESDGTSLNTLSADQLIAALNEGRALFAGPVSAPQVSVNADGCPTSVPDGTLRDGADNVGVAELCARSVAEAPTPEAAQAIKWAFQQLGAPYACDGIGRSEPFRFDCSSLVTRAYYEGAGLNTAGDGWAPSTRDLMPWDGVPLADWAGYVAPEESRPGDFLLYRSCTSEPCSYQHVVMKIADNYVLETNRCGDVAHVSASPGTSESSGFVVARRVIPEKAR